MLFAFNDFPIREIERRRLAKKEITLVVTQRNSLVGTIANPLVGFRKIPFLGTVEKPLIRTVVKMIQNGCKENAQFRNDGTGDFSTPRGAEWFHVKLTVSTASPSGEVKVYMKGTLVTSWNPRYPIKNHGGVLVANGYKNVVYYKNFNVQ